MVEEKRIIDPGTFGGSQASKNLSDILTNQHPQCVRRVGAFYGSFSEMMVQMMNSWKHFYNGGLLELMQLYRDKKFQLVKDSNLPEVVKSHLLNVMTQQYRLYRKVAKNLIERQRQENLPKQRFHIGQHVFPMHDVKDSYGETYISKGEVVKVQNYHEDQKGYEYELPYGFCLGEKDLRRV